jgi:hypothetical protein
MKNHASQAELQAFLKGTMPPDRLLALDDHLAACPPCRAALEAESQPTLLSANVESTFEPQGPHLNFEVLRALTQNRAVTEEDAIHAVTCTMCAAELADLRHFAAELAQTPRSNVVTITPRPRPVYLRLAFYAALAACLALAATTVFFRHAEPPVEALGLKDGAQQLSLDQTGQLHGADSLPNADRALLQAALQTGHLELPAQSPNVTRTETILGRKTATTSFSLIAPLTQSVLNLQPTFTWKVLPTATSYTVSIYASGYRKLMESPALTATTWRPESPLEPGSAYTWTVTAHTPSGPVREPAPPDAEAAFSVASIDQLAYLQDHAGDPLLLATVYARAGAITEARQQLDQVVAQNPGNALAIRLRDSLN